MAYLHGRNLIVKRNGTAIAGAKSCEININCEELETSTPVNDVSTDGGWKKFIAGAKEWTVTVGKLVTESGWTSDLLSAGQMYNLSMEVDGYGSLSGRALCNQVRITASVGNLTQGSFAFRGSGRLT